METQIYGQTLGGSYSNIYIMPIDAPFPEGARQDLYVHTHTYMHAHTNKMAITQACFCLSLLEVEKRGVWKWVSERKEAQDEVCYSASPRGVRTTRRTGESAHCPHMPHTNTHTHTLDRKQALPQQNPICCNICQRKVKMSVNWGYFLHLSLTTSHLLSSHPRLWGGFILHPFLCTRFSTAAICRCHQKCK